MDNYKRPSDQTNGGPEPKRPKNNEPANEKLNLNGVNRISKCPVCLWPIHSSKCYHSSYRQESLSR